MVCLLSATPSKEKATISDVQEVKKYKGSDVFMCSLRDTLSKEGPLANAIHRYVRYVNTCLYSISHFCGTDCLLALCLCMGFSVFRFRTSCWAVRWAPATLNMSYVYLFVSLCLLAFLLQHFYLSLSLAWFINFILYTWYMVHTYTILYDQIYGRNNVISLVTPVCFILILCLFSCLLLPIVF